MKRSLFFSLLAILYVFPLAAQAPQWWSDRSVINPQASSNDFAPVNQGQLKYLATQAYIELQENLPGGGGADVQRLTSAWMLGSGNDFLPVNLGQLKNVAKPFYDRLIAVGFTDDYPWESSANPPADFALANIGQVKNLFSFDITFSSDSDPLPDWWRMHHFGMLDVSSEDSAPGDPTLKLKNAYAFGRNPNVGKQLIELSDDLHELVSLTLYTTFH